MTHGIVIIIIIIIIVLQEVLPQKVLSPESTFPQGLLLFRDLAQLEKAKLLRSTEEVPNEKLSTEKSGPWERGFFLFEVTLRINP